MGTTRNYLLDGLRGIAALAVVIFHVGLITQREVVPGGYLAVDFFFVLSGFVIDRAYRSRLQNGLTAPQFIMVRLYRLYPLFALGATFGLVRFALELHSHQLGLSPGMAAIAAGANVLMLPVPFHFPVAFPLNKPAWSLFAEMVVNIVFALGLFRAPRPILWAMIVGGAAGMLIGVVDRRSGLNLGWRLDNLQFGLARVAFGFPLGMILARRFDARPNDAKPTHVAAPVLLLLAGMLLPVPDAWRGAFDLAFAFVGVPLIVALGARACLAPRLNPLLYWLGVLSYPLYAVHFPMLQFVHGAGARYLPPIALGVTMVVVAVAAAFSAEWLVDQPARRRGASYLRRVTAKPV